MEAISRGKFLGRPLSFDKVFEGLCSLWQTQDEWEIFPMSYGSFIFHFIDAVDIDRVLCDCPWSLDEVVLALGAWSLNFRPSLGLLPRVTIWMRLPDLPMFSLKVLREGVNGCNSNLMANNTEFNMNDINGQLRTRSEAGFFVKRRRTFPLD